HVLHRNARTAITHRQTHRVTLGNNGQINRAVGRAKLVGVENQVDQHLAQSAAVAQHFGGAVRKSDAQALAALLQERSNDRFDISQQIEQTERLAVQLQAAFTNRRRAQQVLD